MLVIKERFVDRRHVNISEFKDGEVVVGVSWSNPAINELYMVVRITGLGVPSRGFLNLKTGIVVSVNNDTTICDGKAVDATIEWSRK